MSRHVVVPLVAVLFICGGCAARSAPRSHATPSQGQRLMHPPDVPDTRYPGGVHIQSDAPLTSWHQVAVFATREECEASRIQRIDESIDKARIEVGERAKYQLSVRRAVNARCVEATSGL
jgi:hypothetical protein